MKRSKRSKLVEYILLMRGTKQRYSDKVKFAKFLEQKRTENAKPYILPRRIQQKLNIAMEHSYGKDCYILQGNKQANEKYIIYLHGGGYVNQPLGAHWKFMRKITDLSHATMIVPVYPKVPLHKYHESYDQVLPIYEKLLMKTSPQNIIFMGDSAGGGFALALAQLLKEKDLPQPSRIILLSPWLDITLSNPDIQKFEKNDAMLGSYGLAIIGKLYAGDTDPNQYLLSPINGDIQGLGEISLFIGTHELLLADARKFRDRAKKEGVMINYYEYPKMNHVFPALPIPEAKKAIRQIIDLIS
ncbi:alpha/beta hydrolase fold domain-containing protein [Paenibacillus harenae]|uniref:alpha/beta hydrolase fold domain-containing protein n=1 Tax=Paenibacillus harenae TaxID=306543 RepID=UPI00278DBE09|nr:alpha/beta hydrolase [Paenibacillus harenae]MDQ0057878.1 acetyl esterase/lipase [Paenibacillus harenae]